MVGGPTGEGVKYGTFMERGRDKSSWEDVGRSV